MLRIIVVDDEPRQRKGLVEIICRLRPEDEVIAIDRRASCRERVCMFV